MHMCSGGLEEAVNIFSLIARLGCIPVSTLE